MGIFCDVACMMNSCNDFCSGYGIVNVDGILCMCFIGFLGSICNICVIGYGLYFKCGVMFVNGECIDNIVVYIGIINVTILGK